MKSLYKRFCIWLVSWFNNFFGSISFNNACKAAQALKDKYPGKKVFVILLRGEYVAIGKREFKELWKCNPAMKQFTIQEWQYKIYEHS